MLHGHLSRPRFCKEYSLANPCILLTFYKVIPDYLLGIYARSTDTEGQMASLPLRELF